MITSDCGQDMPVSHPLTCTPRPSCGRGTPHDNDYNLRRIELDEVGKCHICVSREVCSVSVAPPACSADSSGDVRQVRSIYTTSGLLMIRVWMNVLSFQSLLCLHPDYLLHSKHCISLMLHLDVRQERQRA